MKRFVILGVVAAMVIAAAVAVPTVTAGGKNKSAGKPIVIGWTKAFSGFMNFYDDPVSRGAELAVKDINAKGGVLGRPLKIIYADYKTDINLVSSAALQLLNKHVDFVHTGCDYDYGNAAARLANSKGILAFGCAGSTKYGVKGIGPLTFDTWHGNPTEAGVIGQLLVQQKWKHPYFITDLGIEYTKEVCALSMQTWEHYAGKGTIVGKDTMQNSDPSFSAQVNRVKSSNADVLVICTYAPGVVTLVKQLRAAGVNLPIVGSGGTLDGSYWLGGVPSLSNFYAAGGVASIYGDDPNPKINAFTKRFTKVTGKPPVIGQAYIGYSAIQGLAIAITRAHSTNGRKVAKAFETFRNVPLLAGPTTYTATCHVPIGRPLDVTKVTNGKGHWFATIQPKFIPPHIC